MTVSGVIVRLFPFRPEWCVHVTADERIQAIFGYPPLFSDFPGFQFPVTNKFPYGRFLQIEERGDFFHRKNGITHINTPLIRAFTGIYRIIYHFAIVYVDFFTILYHFIYVFI